ncbi:P-loop containing nucleoside triphosphate hydrolase protein [Scleroderma yunnanense]
MESARSINVIVFGETGVGKSSVVNLIAGRPVAEVSPDVAGCTMESKEYKFNVDTMDLSIWDTVGLAEPEMGVDGYIPAIEKACSLIKQLRDAGGVDLLLFCIRGNQFTMTMQNNYRLFYEVLCGQQVPIALVITHLEGEEVMEEWWNRNKDNVAKHGIKCAAHACVTGLPDNKGPDGKCGISQRAIIDLLKQHDGSGRYVMPEGDWLARIIKGLKLFTVRTRSIPKGKNLQNALVKRCGLDSEVAHRIMLTMSTKDSEGGSQDSPRKVRRWFYRLWPFRV